MHQAARDPRYADSDSATEPKVLDAVDAEKAADTMSASASPTPAAAAAAASHTPNMIAVPDGGREAWATIAGSWLVLFCTFGYINAFGVYQDYYLEHFLQDHTASDISWIGSFQVFCMFSLGMVTGRLFDEGYFHYLMCFGSLWSVFALMMVSLAKDFYSIFLSQGIALGLGFGTLFLPAIGIVSHHFATRRALAVGIVVSGSSLGGVIFPIMLNKLFNGSTGFEWGVRASAFMVLGCLLIANLIMSTRLPPRKERPPHMQVKPNVKSILTDAPYLLTVCAMFFITLGLFYPFFYCQVFARLHGVPENIAFYSLAIINAASVFGRVLPNFIADKTGSMNMIIPCTTVAAILQWPWLAADNVAGTVCFAIFYGLFSGAYVSLMASTVGGFARSVTEIGMRLGFCFLFSSFGALLGTPIVGWILGNDTQNFRWWAASTFAGICMLVGVGLLTLSRAMWARHKGTQLV